MGVGLRLGSGSGLGRRRAGSHGLVAKSPLTSSLAECLVCVSVCLCIAGARRRPRLLFPSPSTSPTEAVRLRSPPRLRSPSISPTEAVRRVLGCCRSSQPCWRAWSSRSQSLTPMKKETQLAKRKYRRGGVLEVAKLDAYERRNTACKKEIHGVGPRGRKA